MSSLQKAIAEICELDSTEMDQVSGGEFYATCDLTTTCYTDSKGTEHCVSNRDC
jgi:hypothetical protein